MIPSGTWLDENTRLVVEEVSCGLYVVQNAYGGEYRFFETDPKIPNAGEVALSEARIEAPDGIESGSAENLHEFASAGSPA